MPENTSRMGAILGPDFSDVPTVKDRVAVNQSTVDEQAPVLPANQGRVPVSFSLAQMMGHGSLDWTNGRPEFVGDNNTQPPSPEKNV